MKEINSQLILYISLCIGGITGGILTVWDKVRFVTKKDCERTHIQSCAKMDEIRESIKDLKKLRENDQKIFNGHLLNITRFMGKVDEHLNKRS